VRRNRRIEDSLAVALQGRQRPRLVGAHHAGIANHVRRKDGRKASIGLVFGHAPIRIGDSPAAPASAGAASSKERVSAPALNERQAYWFID
jgi:hypothetical protein